jgi:hypothetical protein
MLSSSSSYHTSSSYHNSSSIYHQNSHESEDSERRRGSTDRSPQAGATMETLDETVFVDEKSHPARYCSSEHTGIETCRGLRVHVVQTWTLATPVVISQPEGDLIYLYFIPCVTSVSARWHVTELLPPLLSNTATTIMMRAVTEFKPAVSCVSGVTLSRVRVNHSARFCMHIVLVHRYADKTLSPPCLHIHLFTALHDSCNSAPKR